MRKELQGERQDMYKTRHRGIIQSLLLVLIFSAALSSGCVGSIPGKGGATHHLIIGLGICSANTESNEAAVVTDVMALGLSISDRPGLKFGLGYSSSTVVTVNAGAEDVRLEVSKRPGGPLVIDSERAVLKQATMKGDGHDHESK